MLDDLPITLTQRRNLDFLLTAHELTAVVRLNRLLDGSRGETSAEHGWHLALAAITLAPEVAPDVDLGRVVTMLLIHDLPEVYAGDVPIYGEAAREAVARAEAEAAERLFGKLPADRAERGITVGQERRLTSVIESYWPALGPVATALIDDAHRRGMLGDDPC